MTAYSSPICPPGVLDFDLCAIGQTLDGAPTEEPCWDKDFCLPPGLFSQGAVDEFGNSMEVMPEDFVKEMGMEGMEGMDLSGYTAYSAMEMMEMDYSQFDPATAEAMMETYMHWQNQPMDPEMMAAMGNMDQEMWPDALTERLHFDKLCRSAFRNTMTMVNEEEYDEAFRTTVMIRNLPNSYTRDMLLELLDSEGFAGRYDFVYLPIDFTSAVNLGYSFVDLIAPADATTFMEHFTGFSNWSVGSDKVCVVSWSSPHQGLEQHVERYRSSPVMHPNIPEDWKPLIFLNGMRVPFPPPTKHIKAPKVRCRPESVSTSTSGG